MTYLQDKKNKNKKLINYSVLIILLGLMVFGTKGIFKFIKPLAVNLQSQVYQTKNYFFEKSVSTLETKESLRSKVTALENKILEYEQKEAENSVQSIELDEIRQILDIKESTNANFAVKKISPLSIYGTFNVSSSAGAIKSGDIVLSKTGYYIGYVTDTNQNNLATVLTAENSKEEISLYLPDSGISVKAKGHSRNVLVAQIPKDTKVEIGEVALLGEYLGVPVGSVVSLSEDVRSPLKEIYIRMKPEVVSSDLFLIKSR